MDRILAAIVHIVTFKVLTSGRWFLLALVLLAFALIAAGCDEVQSDFEHRRQEYFGEDGRKPLKLDRQVFQPLKPKAESRGR